ncbi:unknown [Clostridium sp. CAG:448]|nr:unknown [Clostridium sp. CAG:448]
MEDALVDDLNSIALDLPEIGDIIIEECNNGYAVVPDYRDLLTEILEDTHE